MCKIRVTRSSLCKGWSLGMKYFSGCLSLGRQKSPGSITGEESGEVREKEANSRSLSEVAPQAVELPHSGRCREPAQHSAQRHRERGLAHLSTHSHCRSLKAASRALVFSTSARFWRGPQAELPIWYWQLEAASQHRMVIADGV